jgi:hypothetical protein
MRWLLAAALLAGAVAAWLIDPRLLVAVVIGFVIYRIGTAMLRGMATEAGNAPPEPRPVSGARERTVFRCDTCGTELLLVVVGDDTPPRHCGERMRARTEVPRTN